MRYAGDKAASAEALRIIHIRVVCATLVSAAPDAASWPRFRAALEEVDQAQIRRRVLRDLASETIQDTTPEGWRLGAPAKRVLRLRVRKVLALQPTGKRHLAASRRVLGYPSTTSEAAASQADARRQPRQLPGPLPLLALPGQWRWAVARGAATRVHIAAGCSEGFAFPCLRKDSVLQGSGTAPEDALDTASGLCRTFCGKCWDKLQPEAISELEKLMDNRGGKCGDLR